MTNIETLESLMDDFIIGYGSLQYGGLPFVNNIMINVVPDIPVGMKFSLDDIAEVANYFNTKYPGYFTIDEWNDTMVEYLHDFIGSEPSNGNGDNVPVIESNSGKTLLVIGGAIVLIALLSIK